MPEGASEIKMTPESKSDSSMTRRDFLKRAAVAGAVIAVESTIGRAVPAEASPETPKPEKDNAVQAETQTPLVSKPEEKPVGKERTPEEKAKDAQKNCENFLSQVKSIDASVADMVGGTSFSHANKLLTDKEFAKAQEIFERISDSLLKFATVRVLNEGLKARSGKSYSWHDIREVIDHVVLTPGNPLSELRNYLAEKTLIDIKIVRYFWRGIPVKKVDKLGKPQVVVLYTSLNYSEDINEIAAMAGSFSTEESANAEAIMGGILATPPEKPKWHDITGHLNWLYDRVVIPLESVNGAKVEGSSEEEIPDKRGLREKISDWFLGNKNEPKKAKVLYARASEIIPTY